MAGWGRIAQPVECSLPGSHGCAHAVKPVVLLMLIIDPLIAMMDAEAEVRQQEIRNSANLTDKLYV